MYDGVVTMAGVTAVAVVVIYGFHRLSAVSPSPLSQLPFLSGWQPTEHALSRYHVRWYQASLLFLAFDIEMLFMYPWAVVVSRVGPSAIVEMYAFLGALLVAVVWAWREGALRWV